MLCIYTCTHLPETLRINIYPAYHDCQTRRLVRFQAVCHSANMSSKFTLLIMIVKHLQTALNQTRRRVRRLVWFQAVCHSANISSKLFEVKQNTIQADDNFSEVYGLIIIINWLEHHVIVFFLFLHFMWQDVPYKIILY